MIDAHSSLRQHGHRGIIEIVVSEQKGLSCTHNVALRGEECLRIGSRVGSVYHWELPAGWEMMVSACILRWRTSIGRDIAALVAITVEVLSKWHLVASNDATCGGEG